MLYRWRWPLLALAALLAVLAVWPANRVAFDQSIESMFAPDDPLLAPYLKLKRTFGGNEIVLAVYEDPELLDPGKRGIRRLAEISRRCEQVPGVRAVLSLDRPMGESVVDADADLALRTQRLFENYTHGDDGRTVAITCMLETDSAASVPRRQTVEALRQIMLELPDGLSPGLLAGEPVMVVDGFRYLEEDGQRLGFWSTVCLSITIWLCFRSLRWVVIPIAVVQFTLLLTKALMVWIDLRLTMVSSMLTALVTVIGIATIVHVIVRNREACSVRPCSSRGRGLGRGLVRQPPFSGLAARMRMGFGSLLLARVGPVQDFGLMMALGSMLVLVCTAMLLPGLASWRAPPSGPAAGLGRSRRGADLAAHPRRRPSPTPDGGGLTAILVGRRWRAFRDSRWRRISRRTSGREVPWFSRMRTWRIAWEVPACGM